MKADASLKTSPLEPEDPTFKTQRMSAERATRERCQLRPMGHTESLQEFDRASKPKSNPPKILRAGPRAESTFKFTEESYSGVLKTDQRGGGEGDFSWERRQRAHPLLLITQRLNLPGHPSSAVCGFHLFSVLQVRGAGRYQHELRKQFLGALPESTSWEHFLGG